MALVSPEHVSAILAQVAQEVILPRFRALGSGDVREKKPGDLVTIADIEAEQQLTRQLLPLLAGAHVVGEEGVAADPDTLSYLEGDAPVWVIDPIDGTGNFVKGDPHFAVILALVWRQRTLIGWIHDPLNRRTSFAVQGDGCWSDGQRQRLAASPPAALTGATAWRDRRTLARAGLHFRQVGSAAHEYLALLDGALDFSCYRRLNPWDHAAGVLLHQEAGGTAGLLDGSPYRPLPQSGTLLMAPDQARWESLQRMLVTEG